MLCLLLTLYVFAISASIGAEIPTLHAGTSNINIAESQSSDCGGSFFNDGVFSTPQYPSPYPNRKVCTWTLTAPAGKVVRLVFTNFTVEYGVECSYDSVKIYNGPTAINKNLVKTFCGNKPFIEHVGAQVITVVFASNDNIQETGFTAFFHSISDATSPARHDQGQTTCGGDYQGAFGTIASPNFPDLYPGNANCSYTITVPYGNVQLEILHLDIEYHHSCQRDYLEIREVKSTGKILKRLCGSSKSRKFSSTTQSMHLHFVSDNSLQGTGFYAAWKNDVTPQPVTPEVPAQEPQSCGQCTLGPIIFTTTTMKPTERLPVESSKTPEPVTPDWPSTAGDTPRYETSPTSEVTATDAAFDTSTPDPMTDKATDAAIESITDASAETSTDAATAAVTQSTVTDATSKKPTRAIPLEDATRAGVCRTCKDNGNSFTVVENSGCSMFRMHSDQGGNAQACPRGTKFDVNLCVCNFEYSVKCNC